MVEERLELSPGVLVVLGLRLLDVLGQAGGCAVPGVHGRVELAQRAEAVADAAPGLVVRVVLVRGGGLPQGGFIGWVLSVSPLRLSEAQLWAQWAPQVAANQREAPELVEEMRGIARGAGVSFERLFLLNSLLDIGGYRYLELAQSFAGCASFAIFLEAGVGHSRAIFPRGSIRGSSKASMRGSSTIATTSSTSRTGF